MRPWKPAVVRFYFDADVLGLAKVLVQVRADVTYPGDPGGTLHRRTRPACPITTTAVKDDVWIPQVASLGWLIITRDSRIARNPGGDSGCARQRSPDGGARWSGSRRNLGAVGSALLSVASPRASIGRARPFHLQRHPNGPSAGFAQLVQSAAELIMMRSRRVSPPQLSLGPARTRMAL